MTDQTSGGLSVDAIIAHSDLLLDDDPILHLTRDEWRAVKAEIYRLRGVKVCEPIEDPRAHDFQGWVTFDEGRGGTTVCTRCGMTSFAHSMRYAP